MIFEVPGVFSRMSVVSVGLSQIMNLAELLFLQLGWYVSLSRENCFGPTSSCFWHKSLTPRLSPLAFQPNQHFAPFAQPPSPPSPTRWNSVLPSPPPGPKPPLRPCRTDGVGVGGPSSGRRPAQRPAALRGARSARPVPRLPGAPSSLGAWARIRR